MDKIMHDTPKKSVGKSRGLQGPSTLSLLQIEEGYKTLTETTNICYVMIDEKGYVLSANREYLKLTGHDTPEEIIGKNIVEWPGWDSKRKIEAVKKCIKQGFLRGFNIQFTKTDGNIIPVELNATVLQDSTGIKILALLKDLSEHHGLEKKLMTSEIRYRLLFENLLGGFVHFRLIFKNKHPNDCIFIEINSTFEKLTGLKNIVGRKLTKILPNIKKMHKELFDISERVASSGKPERFEIYWELSGLWFLIAIYRIEEEYLVAVFDDITERKIAEEKLKHKTKNLEEVNTALKVLLKQVEDSRMELEEKILSNIRELVLPYLTNLKNTRLSTRQLSILNTAESNLNSITSSFLPLLKLNNYGLTPREVEVATLVKEGRTIKDIADLFAVSINTIQFHRTSLRKKLGLKNSNTNLRTHLLNLK